MHYLKISEMRPIAEWYNVQCGAQCQDQLKLVDGASEVSMETQAPDLIQRLNIKQDRECHLQIYCNLSKYFRALH